MAANTSDGELHGSYLMIINVSAWQCLAPQVWAATAAWAEAPTAAQTSWCLAQWWTASQRKVCVVLSILFSLICTFHTWLWCLFTSSPPLLLLADPQRRSQRSRPAVRWKSNRRCPLTLKTRGNSTPGRCFTEPHVSTTCRSWQRRWLMARMCTLRARTKRERLHWFRLWWGWVSPDAAPTPNQQYTAILS